MNTKKVNKSRARLWVLLLLGLFAGCGLNMQLARATTITVNEICTLVDAIDAANLNQPIGACRGGDDLNFGGDIIKLANDVVLTTVNNSDPTYGYVNTGLPVISSTIVIEAENHSIIRDPNAPAFRLIAISGYGNLTLKNLTLRNGLVIGRFDPPGILNLGTLTLVNSKALDNKTEVAPRGPSTGAIGNRGHLTLIDSVISNNNGFLGAALVNESSGVATLIRTVISENVGAGISNKGTLNVDSGIVYKNQGLQLKCRTGGNYSVYICAGGIENSGTATIKNTTIAENIGGVGGGIRNLNNLTIEHSTIVANSAIEGGAGIDDFSGSTILINSLIANNVGGVDCYETETLSGVNFIGDGTCKPTLSGNPLIGPLTYNGGFTLTYALLPGSPALDQINYKADKGCESTSVTTDQRGAERPYPIDGKCDIGAFELTPFPLIPTLDTFDRANGRLGTNWSGSSGLDFYKIINNQVYVRRGGSAYWKPNRYGVNQEAFVTLSTVNLESFEHGLMLKVQSDGSGANYRRGVINVDYHARDNAVLVSTILPNRPWKDYPLLTNVTFNNGDKLSARVYGDGPNAGTVHVYKNGAEIGIIALDRADKAFFNPRGGSIGLWFGDAYGAVFDNFGGGNL